VGYLSQYFSKYYNIYFSLFGIPYNYRKNKYTWSTDISIQITAMFYLQKNITLHYFQGMESCEQYIQGRS
jgi:hypothetical protein